MPDYARGQRSYRFFLYGYDMQAKARSAGLVSEQSAAFWNSFTYLCLNEPNEQWRNDWLENHARVNIERLPMCDHAILRAMVEQHLSDRVMSVTNEKFHLQS